MYKREHQFIWSEAYRPTRIADCILPQELTDMFTAMADNQDTQNLLLTGTAGTGKTTVARALCDELGADYMLINGSEESGIDVLRNKIRDYASSVSLNGGSKVVIIDEADYLNINSTQPALRGFIEEFASTCRFILTCNFPNKIMEAIRSRMAVIDFKIPTAERPKMAVRMFKRAEQILEDEGISYDRKVVAEIVNKFFPDYRRVLNELQRHATTGSISVGALGQQEDFSELVHALQTKNFKAMREWVTQSPITSSEDIFTILYTALATKVESPAELVVVIAEYAYKNAFVADKELNLSACLADIMMNSQFK
jgi:DNA polymerase III delta prime subunit